MQDNYNKDLENKGWAQMSALLDKERPVAVPFWKRAWRKLALGLVLLFGIATTLVVLNQNQDSHNTSTAISEVADIQPNTVNTLSETLNTNLINQQESLSSKESLNEIKEPSTAAQTTTNSAFSNKGKTSKANKSTSNTYHSITPQTQFLVDKNAEILDISEDVNFLSKEPMTPLMESNEAASLKEATDIKKEVVELEPIAQLEQLPSAEFDLDAPFVEIDCNTIMPKAKRIENFIASYDNGFDFGLKSFSSGVFVGLDIPLKGGKWNFRPSLGYNSLRSDIVVVQNSFEDAITVAVNEPIANANDAEWAYATDENFLGEVREQKTSSFFAPYRINELQLQLKAAYRLNDKWSILGGLTPTYLLKNQKGILPVAARWPTSSAIGFDQNPNGAATLGVANQWNLNGLIGIDYQVNPRFSISGAYNHGWVKKARTDLIDTKLKSINLSLNYHF